MTGRLKLCLILLSLPLLLHAVPQNVCATERAAFPDYDFIHLTSRSGLSYDAVKCMFQDSRGYLWIGTHKGLNRYDGTRIRQYDQYALGTSSDYINALTEDSNGNILIGTDDGLVIYDYNQDNFRIPANADIISDRIHDFCADSRGKIWIGARQDGFFCYDPQTDSVNVRIVRNNAGTVVGDIYRLCIDRNDQIYAAVYCDNVYTFSPYRDSVLVRMETSISFEADDVEGMELDLRQMGILYIASKRNGLCRTDMRTGRSEVLYVPSRECRPTRLTVDKDWLWMSTTAGLVQYSIMGNAARVLDNNKGNRFSLSESHVTDVVAGGDGSLFVSTNFSGVNCWSADGNLFTRHCETSDGTSLEGCAVRYFAELSDGCVYVATERLGLLCFDPKGGKIVPYAGNGRLQGIAKVLCPDGQYLWVGYDNGVCRLDTRTGALRSYPHFVVSDQEIDNRVLDILKTSGGRIYVSTSIGAMLYDADNDAFRKIECLGDRAINNMVEDASGILWAASYTSGVYAYDPRQDRIVGHWCGADDGSGIPKTVSSMSADQYGNVWAVGFGNGFHYYDAESGKFQTFDRNVIPDLPTEIFFKSLTDDNGNVWLTSNKGLVEVDRNARRAKLFDESSGLIDNALSLSAIRLRDGRMLFGTVNGFVEVSPDNQHVRGDAPSIALTGFLVGGNVVIPSGNGPINKNVDLAESIQLQPDESTFGFQVACPGHGLGMGDRILCRLEGHETDWTDMSSAMEVTYYNVPPGIYRFQVACGNGDDGSVEVCREVKLEVLPRFWQSAVGIALIVLIVIIAGIGFFYIAWKRKVARMRRAQELSDRQREKDLLQEKMTFFSNVIHEIKTPLTLIRTPLENVISAVKTPALRDDLQVISNGAEYMNGLVKELLEFIRVEKHGYVLELKRLDLVDTIDYIIFNFKEAAADKNIRIRFDHASAQMPVEADSKALHKILNNLLHNALKYASSRIDISVGMEGGSVFVKVANDGAPIPASRREEIFKPFVQFSSDHAPYSQSFGIGLPLARTLAELHGGSLTLSGDESAGVESDEGKSEKGESAGGKLTEGKMTEFVLRLPVKEDVGDNIPVDVKFPEPKPEMPVSAAPGVNMPIMLLVEDNGELSLYLKNKLKADYHIRTCTSAEQAVGELKREKVDIVLTDIALQGMSGVELCQRISSDFDTSHIPIVVMSAISSVDTKIKCMESGASIYIEKPFSLDYLKACLSGVLEKRRKLKEQWSAASSLSDVKSFNLVSRDEEFLNRLESVTREHLSDPDFSVQQLETAMLMSRSSLTRKMKGLLNTSPVEFLKAKRMSVAAEMLCTGNYRVNEVCYAVGFSSPSYFSKCFKNAFGCLPAEYAETAKNSPKNRKN